MSTGKKKFGAFGGVFTPSILTILGVIMYLRLGWVVGNAGLWGALFIVLLAHVISVTTGLSISSIATDKKVGAGGVYYVLSRSLGLPIGGAIGLTLFIGTALSIALYIVGFSESFNAIIGLDASIDNIRLTGSIALLLLTIIAFISTSLAIKTQYFILGAIFISLGAIFLGSNWIPEIPAAGLSPSPNASFETVFAIFFPAVTGFTAGIAMSGDLKDPKKAIPVGTIAAISVGFVVYIALTIFLFYKVDAETLKSDYNILEKIALFSPAVIAGIWGATLSSALGGILGGPRILQAMSLDKITPGIFGKEQGKTKEPRIALIIAILLAESGILIGDLDIVARVVSMFYLAAYGFINISFFLESWASADFRPSFKVNKWFGFIGFLATFGIMFQLDILAMVLALLIIGGIYLWLTRREIALGTGDIWRSVWSTSVKEGLKRLEQKEDHKRNWKPNILLFSGNSEARPYLIEFSQALSGRAGLVTNFDLIENEGMDVLFTKHKQSVKDELLQKYGIFGRRIDVKNIYKGIETIAATFGFSGIDPNTILMGWARNTKDPIWFANMTQKLIDLDYNVLYMDYDEARGFGQRQQIDLWWRGISNNAELMLQAAKFISFNADWRKANIRILLVNDYNVDRRIIENRISSLLDEFRLKAEIKVIDNHLDRKPFYNILKVHSLKSDLVFIGIPNIIEGSEEGFVKNTNDLVEIIGSTLLVKASSTFDVTHLGLKEMAEHDTQLDQEHYEIAELQKSGVELVDRELNELDAKLQKAANNFAESSLVTITQHYLDFIQSLNDQISTSFNNQENEVDLTDPKLINPMLDISKEFTQDTMPLLSEILTQGIDNYLLERKRIILDSPQVLKINPVEERKSNDRILKIKWQKALDHFNDQNFTVSFVKALKEFGIVSVGIVTKAKEGIKLIIDKFGKDQMESADKTLIEQANNDLIRYAQNLVINTILDINTADRDILNRLAKTARSKEFNKYYRSELFNTNRTASRARHDFIENYGFFWLRNQQLFHHRFETGIELKRTNKILEEGTVKMFQHLRINPVQRIMSKIEFLLTELEKEEGFEAKSNLFKDLGLNISMFDYLPEYRQFMKSISKATHNLPSEVEMMDTNSEINIQDKQGDGITTVSFSVDKIAEYLIETSFVSSVHENLEQYNKDINSNIAELISFSNEIGNRINKNEITETNWKSPLNDYKNELTKIKTSTQTNLEVFEAEVSEKLEGLVSQLKVQHIIDQAEILKQYIRKKEIESGFRGKLRGYRSNINTQVLKGAEWISKRKEERKIQEFNTQFADLYLPMDHIRSFIDLMEMDSIVNDSLPFYYKQLFSGKHLQSQKTDSNRGREIDLVRKTISNIDSGLKGGILISGASLSGKSFLTEKIVNQVIPGKVFYIRPPQGGAIRKVDLDDALSLATGQSGKGNDILSKNPERSIFVFSDLEMWWLNHPDGNKVIDYLVDLVNSQTNGHYFIFNCNIYALAQIKQKSRINEMIAATILLQPLSKNALKEELLKRHKTGGISLYLKGELLTHNRMDRHIDRFFKSIYSLSQGNIGKALHLWLKSIVLDNEGKFMLIDPENYEFPTAFDSDWTNVLTQLSVHRGLSFDRFHQLYEFKSKDWRKKMIRQLQSSLILEETNSLQLRFKKNYKPYIEKYLIEEGKF